MKKPIKKKKAKVRGRGGLESRVLYSATATGDGTWIESSYFTFPCSITFEGTFGTDSLQVCVSNAPVKPADATHGVAYSTAVTAVGVKAITEFYRWIKVRKTAGTAAITATLGARLEF